MVAHSDKQSERYRAFVADTIRATGVTEQEIDRGLQVGTFLAKDAAPLLDGSPLANDEDGLLDLVRHHPDEQVPLARLLQEGGARTVSEARAMLGFDEPRQPRWQP